MDTTFPTLTISPALIPLSTTSQAQIKGGAKPNSKVPDDEKRRPTSRLAGGL